MSDAVSAVNEYRLASWNLEELLTSPQELDAALADLEQRVQSFEQVRAQLPDLEESAALLEVVEAYEAIMASAYKLGAYASLWFSADTQCESALTFRNRVQQALTGLQNRVLFFSLWWKGLEDEQAAALMPPQDGSRNADVRFYLEDLRRFRPYTLDEAREQIINVKDADGIDAVLTLYSMLTNRMEFRLTPEGGEPEVMTRDRLMSFAYSHVPEEREAAYRELYRVYEEQAPILAQMYIHRVRDWHNENVELRAYENAIAVRNVSNDVSNRAVATLIDVVRQNASLFQRYFRLKASWLGVERLRRYDIYAPLSASQRTVAYGDAVAMVLDTFSGFDPRFGSAARRVFDEQHIDSEMRRGKKGGAFCATVVPELTPWVLVNYSGRLRDVATLAHELGHAVHSMLAEDHSMLVQHPSLPLAETASVFGEMLLTDRLLQIESDPSARRELVAGAVDDIYATVTRQTYFVRFEMLAHQAIMEGRSADEINELYQENLNEQFGDSLELSPEFRHEWISIPHIYSTPFYCYAYSFGQLLVLSLYRRYLDEGPSFKPVYFGLLAAGGSQRPGTLLEQAGVDVEDEAFWRGGFELVRDWIDQLERDG